MNDKQLNYITIYKYDIKENDFIFIDTLVNNKTNKSKIMNNYKIGFENLKRKLKINKVDEDCNYNIDSLEKYYNNNDTYLFVNEIENI